jgi:hypothetical protein
VVGSENGEIGKGFREMLRPAKDGAIHVDDRVALAWIFKQCGTASSSVKSTSMEISDAVRILSDEARQIIQGVAAHTVAPFSFDCEVIVELTIRFVEHKFVAFLKMRGMKCLIH